MKILISINYLSRTAYREKRLPFEKNISTGFNGTGTLHSDNETIRFRKNLRRE